MCNGTLAAALTISCCDVGGARERSRVARQARQARGDECTDTSSQVEIGPGCLSVAAGSWLLWLYVRNNLYSVRKHLVMTAWQGIAALVGWST